MKMMMRSMLVVLAAAIGAPAQSAPKQVKALEQVREALKNNDFEVAEIGLRKLWGEGGSKSRIKKVSDEEWGGATGRPPRLPQLERPRPAPPREQPPSQDRPRPETPRPPQSEIPALPPSAIPGTTRPTR